MHIQRAHRQKKMSGAHWRRLRARHELDRLDEGFGVTPYAERGLEGNINQYAEAMRKAPGEPGAWDWNRTATNPMESMITNSNGNIVAGHHRFLAAAAAGVKIPDGVVKIKSGITARVPRLRGSVTMRPGFRPGR